MKKIIKFNGDVKSIYPVKDTEFTLNVGSTIGLNILKDKKVGDEIYVCFGEDENDIHEFGIKAEILSLDKKDASKIKNAENDHYYATVIKIENIIKLENIDITVDGVKADIKDVNEKGATSKRVQELKEELKATFVESDTSKRFFKNGFEPVVSFNKYKRNEYLYEVARNYNEVDNQLNKTLISDKSLEEKYEAVIRLVEIAAIREDVRKDVKSKSKEAMDKANKDYALMEELKVIQNELGNVSDITKEADRFEETIKKSKMPKDLKTKALDEVKRLRTMSAQHADTNVIRQFVQYLIDLPWENEQEENLDLKEVKKILEDSHHGMDKVKKRIIEYLAVRKLVDKNPNTIMCLVGAPGVGKTSISIAIAEALGRKLVKQSLGGISDENEIRGHRRTYVGAMPGRIIKGMIEAKTTNPVFLLDEIDKMGASHKGDPTAALLEVLDPAQNCKFRDNYLGEEYDLSNVMFIATANYLEQIPHALRDRMEIIQIDPYMQDEKVAIAEKHIIPKQLKEHGLTEEQLSFTKDGIVKIVKGYTREAGVRTLTKAIAKVCRKVAAEIVIEDVKSVKVDSREDVVKYLEKELIRPELNEIKEAQVGMVNGLAFMSNGGGSCLPIEAAHYPGEGKVFITPSAKEANSMMTDSIKTIISVLKMNRDKLGIDKDFDFSKTDIHVNYAGNQQIGGVDGPSAGNAMALAILSSITGKKLKADFAITGAIDLRGNARAIGGVKEKALGAYNVGIKTMYLPEENSRDVEDITDEVKSKLEVKTYKHFLDVAGEVLVEDKGNFIELFKPQEINTVVKVAAVKSDK